MDTALQTFFASLPAGFTPGIFALFAFFGLLFALLEIIEI